MMSVYLFISNSIALDEKENQENCQHDCFHSDPAFERKHENLFEVNNIINY